MPGLDQRARVVADQAACDERPLAGGVVTAGDGVPGVERRAEARIGPLDRRTGRGGEGRDGIGEALAHLAVEPDVAEVGGGGDAQAGEVTGLARGSRVVAAEIRQAERIERIGAGHDRERAAALGDAARERAEVREQQPAGAVGRPRDEAVGRLEADRPAERGRDAHRAAAVGAERELADAERERARGAAGAAPGGAVGGERVARLAVELVAGRAAVAELGHVAAADGDRAGRLEACDARGACVRDRLHQRARAGRGEIAGLAHRVLDRERPAGQRAGVLAALEPLLQRTRPLARRLGVDQAERVDERIDLRDARERSLHACHRREGGGHAQLRSTRLPGTMSSRPSGQRTQAL